jgi:large subunit ribosomal protein L21
MYAIIETGGKQYQVEPGRSILIEKLPAEAGSAVTFDRVLFVNRDGQVAIGTPVVPKATVTGQVVRQARGPKIIVFKKKRRKNYRRTHGHRQSVTEVKITEIAS